MLSIRVSHLHVVPNMCSNNNEEKKNWTQSDRRHVPARTTLLLFQQRREKNALHAGFDSLRLDNMIYCAEERILLFMQRLMLDFRMKWKLVHIVVQTILWAILQRWHWYDGDCVCARSSQTIRLEAGAMMDIGIGRASGECILILEQNRETKY